jgi:drug/metabolite transporter (DMT)-like permease
MIYLSLSVVSSVIVGVLLKLAKRYQINVMQAVTWNYLFAIVLGFFFLKPDFSGFSLTRISPVFLLLGVLLPFIFLMQGKAVRYTGLVRTDIAQRLSLFLSLCAAYFLFKEHFDRLKYLGLIFGFVAIFLTLYRKSENPSSKNGWVYLLLVFVGFGTIDVLFKLISQSFTTSLFIIFCIAFIFSLAYIVYLAAIKKTKLQLVNFVCGCVLGFFNFCNILFYLKAHRQMADQPFIVFATMNIGVIILGSLIGIFAFKEKLSKLNYFGLLLALVAVTLITLSKFHAV